MFYFLVKRTSHIWLSLWNKPRHWMECSPWDCCSEWTAGCRCHTRTVFLPCGLADVASACTCRGWHTDSVGTDTDVPQCASECDVSTCSAPPKRSCTRCSGAASHTCADISRVSPAHQTLWTMHHIPNTSSTDIHRTHFQLG